MVVCGAGESLSNNRLTVKPALYPLRGGTANSFAGERGMRASAGPLPGTEELCARHVCLPISAVLTPEQGQLVLRALQATLA